MNVALVVAGGSGQRMKNEVPKQFINVYDKPVVIYTLEGLQVHPEIDAILAVCLEGWHDILWAYANQYGVEKLRWVVVGGDTVQESIRNGVYHLRDICGPDDIIVIHDGIRPLVESSVVSDVLVKCRRYGNAVTAMPYYEQIFVMTDETSSNEYIRRERVRRVSTPQAYRYDKLLRAYERAFAEGIGIHETAYTNTMMVDLGETIYFAAGSDKNIKLTTKDDLELFKALLQMEKDGRL